MNTNQTATTFGAAALAAFLLAAGLSSASAAPVQFSISGTVLSWNATGGSIFTDVLPGTAFTGTFGYDTNPAAYSSVTPGLITYYADNAPRDVVSLSVQIGAYGFSLDDNEFSMLSVFDNPSNDGINVEGSISHPDIPLGWGTHMNAILWDTSDILPNDLPPATLDLNMFGPFYRDVYLDFGYDTEQTNGQLRIESLTQVPEPSTLVLAGVGLASVAAIALRRRRLRRGVGAA